MILYMSIFITLTILLVICLKCNSMNRDIRELQLVISHMITELKRMENENEKRLDN